MTNTPQTVRQFVEWATLQFDQAELCYGHGTDNAHDEAVYLVFSVLELPFDAPESSLDQNLSSADRKKINSIIKQRIETRQPAAYLLGEAWFCGLPFYVNEKVLVPRSPFAELILDQFQPWMDKTPDRILDIGTGSGCIAIACALAFSQARVDAIDVSQEALHIATRNVQRHSLEDRLQLIKSDLFSALGGRKYDLIVSNPPYVSKKDIDALPAEYHHEPVLGLYGGGDGLEIVRRMLAEAKQHLTENGLLFVEVGLMDETLNQTMPQTPFTWLEFENGGEGVFMIEAREL